MASNYDLAKAMYAYAKHGIFVRHQECETVKAAARRLEESQRRIDALRAEVEELKYRLAEREGIQEDDAYLEAAAPGEAAEDFWEEPGEE